MRCRTAGEGERARPGSARSFEQGDPHGPLRSFEKASSACRGLTALSERALSSSKHAQRFDEMACTVDEGFETVDFADADAVHTLRKQAKRVRLCGGELPGDSRRRRCRGSAAHGGRARPSGRCVRCARERGHRPANFRRKGFLGGAPCSGRSARAEYGVSKRRSYARLARSEAVSQGSSETDSLQGFNSFLLRRPFTPQSSLRFASIC